MGALLADTTERLEREAFFTNARRQLSRLRSEDPTGWEADRSESRTWQVGTDRDGLDTDDVPGWWE